MQIKENMKYKFFWKGSVFSNWYMCDFVIDGITFNCVEQYMMYKKAQLFNDYENMNNILESNNPKDIKYFGRSVKNYDNEAWSSIRYEIVKHGNLEKYKQNPNLLEMLLKYKECIFVEASPCDRLWGIGFDEKNAMKNISKWGENYLGKILNDILINF